MGTIAFLMIFGVANAGLFGLPWYTALVGALALSLHSFIELRGYHSRLANVGFSTFGQALMLASPRDNFIVAGLAYSMGVAVRLVMLG